MSQVRYKFDETSGQMVEDHSLEASSPEMIAEMVNFDEEDQSSCKDFEWPEDEKSVTPRKAPKSRSSKELPASKRADPGNKLFNDNKGKRKSDGNKKTGDSSNYEESDSSVEMTPEKKPNKKKQKTATDPKSYNSPEKQKVFTLYAHKADLKRGFKGNLNLSLWRIYDDDLLQKFGRNERNPVQFLSSMYFYSNNESRKDEFVSVKVICVNESGADISTVVVLNESEVEKICADERLKWARFDPLMSGNGKARDAYVSHVSNQENQETQDETDE